VWGQYIDQAVNATQSDCGNQVAQDHFRVRIYNDFEGLPCDIIADTPATSVRADLVGYSANPPVNVDTWGFQLTLNTPITGLDSTGQTIYWLEVSNNPTGSIPTCVWFWDQQGANTPKGNHYSASGSNSGYPSGSERDADYSWCLNGHIVSGGSGDIIRNCCNCIAGTCSLATLHDCSNANGIWDVDNQTISCGNCIQGGPYNDHCTSTIGNYVTTGSYRLDIQCADTDGPTGQGNADEFGFISIAYDVWYRFQAPVNCTMVASMCATGTAFDSVVAIYHKPGDPNFCPTDANSGNTFLAPYGNNAGQYWDENCTGFAIGGAGFATATATAGETYIVRAGAFNGASRGSGQLDISCTPTGNAVAIESPVALNEAARGPRNCGQPMEPCIGGGLTPDSNRYLAVSVPASGGLAQETAIQLKRVSLMHPLPPSLIMWDPNFSAFENQFSYAGTPTLYCQNGGEPPCASPSEPMYAISVTQCTPNYIDWEAALNGAILYITGLDIVPSSKYDIRQLAAICAGNEINCPSGSAPCTYKTARWGDTTAPFQDPNSQVQTQPNISDVAACVDVFKERPSALPMPRCDLGGATSGGLVDFRVQINDVASIVDAFKSLSYPYVGLQGPMNCP
jgi:hypothetical protein